MPPDAGGLQRRLGLPSAVAITVGGVIGSGIFLTPLGVAQALPSALAVHAMWLGLGFVCLCGAFAYAELGAMFPEAGGQYAFLRAAWGPLPAFLFGWVFFWIITPGSIAGLAVAFATAVLEWCRAPAGEGAVIAVGALMIAGLAAVNLWSVAAGAVVQNVATAAKVLALLLLVGAGAFATGGNAAGAAAAPVPGFGLDTLATAFVGVFWTYEGWYELTFSAAELRRPERDLPRGLILGLCAIVLVCAAVNATYLHLVPLAEQRTLPADPGQALPAAAFERAFGSGAASWLLLLIALSVFGSANPGLLSSTRAFYAMAQDGLLPRALVRVHPRRGTPTVAIAVQALVAIVEVVALPRFGDLAAFVVFASFLFYALTVAGVYRLRALQPALPRPYRCTGYPWTPALFVGTALLFVVALLSAPQRRREALWGLAILLTGAPAYLWLVRRRPR
jgi:APA family basic amino acid/polyamine antiporter